MNHSENTKSIELTASWKNYFIPYLLALVTIPLFGIGLIALYFIYRKQHGIRYQVTDRQISSIDQKYLRNIDLVNITSVKIHQSWLQKKLGVGTLLLKTSASEMKLRGMENPGQLKQILETAIATEQQRTKDQQKQQSREPKFEPGNMEKMNYLTGLWQQGLISNKDFDEERKNFE